MVTMMIADDELPMIKQLFNHIVDKQNEIQLIGISNNGIEIIEHLKKDVPDILLLDLMMPKMSGIEVLEEIIHNEEKYFPKLHIVVISGYIEKLYNPIRYINYIYAILSKPYKNMELEQVINNINNDIEYNQTIEYIEKELSKFEFNINSMAYQYLKESIYEILYRKNRNFELEKDIYVKIAKMNNTKNAKNIKWSIEKLINKMYLNTKCDIIQKYFGFQEDKKPSTKLLIRVILDNYIEKYN